MSGSSSCVCVCFFKQKTAYEMRISDWSSDVCSSDLAGRLERQNVARRLVDPAARGVEEHLSLQKLRRTHDDGALTRMRRREPAQDLARAYRAVRIVVAVFRRNFFRQLDVLLGPLVEPQLRVWRDAFDDRNRKSVG